MTAFDIRLVRKHALSRSKARALAERAIHVVATYDVQTDWEGDVLRFRRPGVDGQVRFTPSQIRVEVKLGLLLRPFRSRLAAQISQQLDRLLEHSHRRSA
ncbi:MAG TPA: polyhydroxyalkanoic acid system family protein [Burkholderiales bacterium]|nr:polyhydroxyalkanoic acid system family protein [Burkholderiales bacterium]